MCECNEKQLGAVEYAPDNNNYCEVSVKLNQTGRINRIDIYVRCHDYGAQCNLRFDCSEIRGGENIPSEYRTQSNERGSHVKRDLFFQLLGLGTWFL